MLNNRQIRNKIRQLFPKKDVIERLREKLTKGSNRKVILMDVPTNGNMGDQAIVYATKEFLKKQFPKMDVIEIPNDEVNSSLKYLKKNSNLYEAVIWNGGGNIGNLYPTAEYARWDSFQILKNKKFIIFPQSIHFSENSKKFEEKSIKSFSKVNNLDVFYVKNKAINL
ncbi:polysaccharide pyruvyl transferase family protein [Lactiplantibacillus carotarum]|uniref:polysaccharide pyruvyl transferase family protein n=1 Tax=Lactiplantibacillus carotarum TaxID=2993456 RepID=UPI00298ED170|nr:polysaccharide pyruvyl transferase family protein [Lactiplantibacillus carotarum]